MPARVNRACDRCRRRKVKCDGGNPCGNCSKASLSCTQDIAPQKKGPRRRKENVISELCEVNTQWSLKPDERWPTPASLRTPGLLTPEIIKTCTDFFFKNLYYTIPILYQERLEQSLQALDTDADAYCLLTALCAFVLIQPGVEVKGEAAESSSDPTPPTPSGPRLLEESVNARRTCDYIKSPSQVIVTTSFFIFGCYFGLGNNSLAWFYLREATTFAQILRMDDENTYTVLDPVSGATRRRLYWLLFATERAYALKAHGPLTLSATIELPIVEEDTSELMQLVNLLLPFDGAMVKVAQDLMAAKVQTPRSTRVHGLRLIEKLFDVVNTLKGTVAYMLQERNSLDISSRDLLMEFVSLFLRPRGGNSYSIPIHLTDITNPFPSLFPYPHVPLGGYPSSAVMGTGGEHLAAITAASGECAFTSALLGMDPVTLPETIEALTAASEAGSGFGFHSSAATAGSCPHFVLGFGRGRVVP